MSRVLVTDGEQRSSLAAVRSLGRAGHRVTVCSAHPSPLAGASRFCASERLVPDPHLDASAFRDACGRLIDEEGIEVALPMTDASAPHLIAIRDERDGLAVPFPSLPDYEAVSDKGLLLEHADEAGIPVPRQVVLASPDDPLPATLGQLGSSVVVKPARSAVQDTGGTRRFLVRMVGPGEDVAAAVSDYPREAYPLLVQERIQGPGLGAFLLAWDGELVASFAHRRIREKPPSGGVSVYRESVALRSDLLDYSRRLLERFRWRGVAMVEFKEDDATGVPYLMEVNGRFWGSLQLAVDAGVDFPTLLVRLASGERVEPVRSYRTGVTSRWEWGDVDHLLAMLTAAPKWRHTSPELPGRLGTLARVLLPWRPGERWEVLRPGDPKPFLRESAQWIGASFGRR